MRYWMIIVLCTLATISAAAESAKQSQLPSGTRVVDRIVARIEGDIILESQVRELGAFQKLVEGRSEPDDRLLQELIEQWVVETEATESRFPEPAQSEVDREMVRLAGQFESPAAYVAKLHEVNLTVPEVRRLLARQIFVERYLDYRFRPTVQVEPGDIESYYQKELLPELAQKNQPAPSLAEVEEKIRELLTQREISVSAGKWLDETKSGLKIELAPDATP
jgi:hypothetical protein